MNGIKRLTASDAREQGASILTVAAGVGLLIGILAAMVAATTLSIQRQAKAAELGLKEHAAAWPVLARAGWLLSEQLTTLLTHVTLSQTTQSLNALEPGWHIELEDESGKINLHHAAFALPYVMSRSAGIAPHQSESVVQALAEHQGMLIARSQSMVAYPWRPPAAYSLTVEPKPAPGYSAQDRHMLMGRFHPLPPWKPLETPYDLYQLTEDPAIKVSLPALTTVPHPGINVNTCSETVLEALLAWQRDALVAHPQYSRAWDAMIFTKERTEDPSLPEPAPYHSVTRRLFGSDQGQAGQLVFPKFRGVEPAGAPTVVAQRPLAAHEIIQPLAVHSFLFPMNYEWDHWYYAPTEAVHLKLFGPGPYCAHSNGAFTVKLTGRSHDLTTIIRTRLEDLPQVVRWTAE